MKKEIVKELYAISEGQARLARMLAQQAKTAASPSQRKEVAELRDQITRKLASIGLIDQIDAPAFRESLDGHGGAEHLIAQLLDHFQQTNKTASNPEGIGSVGTRGAEAHTGTKAPEVAKRYKTYQPLYSY
ncbi:MAG: hypothetical protein KatS3mg109_0059 [Pirellulaceae bacterium]|nr:MAG: hypothetical protein KatS3mg109_0059 [Pirellulaceae bacterium]